MPTIGRVRGLSSTSTPAGVFTILAFDHRQSFVKMLDPGSPEAVPYGAVVEAKSSVVRALAPYASAILLDPLYGAAQCIASGALPGGTGLLVAIEESGYTGASTARRTNLLEGWSVEKIKRMGAQAVKLLVYYHPGAGELSEQQESLTAGVIRACRQADIPLFLEAITYSLEAHPVKDAALSAAQRPQRVVETARRLGTLGPDVLKLEFPVDVRHETDETSWRGACEAVSQVAPCPWTVLSAGVDFETFARQVRVACKAGASGYIAGRAVWKEGIPLPKAERETWLAGVAAPRLERLAAIANQYARPWTDFYPGLAGMVREGWYADCRA